MNPSYEDYDFIEISDANSVNKKSPDNLFRFHEYRNHRFLNASELQDLSREDFLRILSDQRAISIAMMHRGEVVAVSSVTPLIWDSTHFSISMGKLDLWVGELGDVESISRLISVQLAKARESGIAHISFHVDADNYIGFNAAAQSGFRLVDAKRTFICRKYDKMRFDGVRLFSPRRYKGSDRGQVVNLYENSKFISRFARDPSLCSSAVGELNINWIQNLLDKSDEDGISLVVERRGRIIAASSGAAKYVSVAGNRKKMLADGLFACLPMASGSYLSMMRSFIEISRDEDYDLVETKVSLNNLPVNRALQYIGGDSVSCHYALHKFLD